MRAVRNAAVALLATGAAYVVAMGHPHRCSSCGRWAWCLGDDCARGDDATCPDCVIETAPDADLVDLVRPTVERTTARMVLAERTDEGDRITLDYIAGPCPLPGQIVVLRHGPRPEPLPDNGAADELQTALNLTGGHDHEDR